MSTTIDNKVVSMEFDNRNFERNVNKSMQTIDKLKQKLNFDKTAQSFDGLDKAAQKVRFDTMEHGIDKVKMKLSALDVFAVTAFHRMSNAAITTGKNMIEAFTIDPVKSGLQEYETQINAVQTILANTKTKGSTIDDVNKALDELNTYADKTIYNFTEMTRNIGTFTAAGVGLKESTQAIKGIANLAAVSGSNAQQASTAMYQLSQALAAGKVNLQDWNSVVNAGMGGEVFQEALKRTSRLLGTGVDEAIEKYGTFRESLSRGAWLTNEVLTETLAQLSGAYSEADLVAQGYTKKQAKEIVDMAQTATDAATKVKTFTQLMDTLKEAAQSGWTQTWELIIGDFEEAKALFTEASDFIGDIIGKSADNRNNLVKGAMQNIVSSDDWTKLEKAGVVTKSFKNAIIETAKSYGVSVKEMMKDGSSFEDTLKSGWLTGDILKDTMNKNEKQLSKSTLKMCNSLKEYFKVSNQVMKGSWGKGKQMQEALTKAGYDYAQVQNLVNGMTEYGSKKFEKMCMAQLKSEGVTKKQAKALVELAKQAKETGTPVNELMEKMERKSGRELLIDTIRNSALAIIKPFKAMKKAWNDIFPPATSEDLYGIINALHEFSIKIVNIDKDGSKLTRTFRGVFSIVKLFTSLISGGVKLSLTIIRTILKYFNLDILEVTATIGDFITNIEQWIEKNNILVPTAKLVGNIIAKLAENVYELFNKFKSIPEVQNAISKFGKEFKNAVSGTGDSVSKVGDKINAFIDIIKKIDDVSLEDIKNIFTSLRTDISDSINNGSNAIGQLKDTIVEFVSTVKNKLGDSGILGPLLTIATGLLIIKTVKKLNSIFNTFSGVVDKLEKPIKAATSVMDKMKNTLKAYAFNLKSEAILNIAKAITLLAGSLFILSKINPKKLFSAAGALTVLCAALAVLCFVIGKFNVVDVGKISTSMIAISGSLLILVTALKTMDGLKSKNIPRNLRVISALIAGITLFTAVSGKFKGNTKSMASILLFAVALRMMINSLQKLDGLDIKNLKSDLLALNGMIFLLGMISKSVGNVRLTEGAGLLLMVVSLRMFMKTLASMATFDYRMIQSNIGSIATIIGLFAVLIAASNRAGKNAAKAGVMILSISVSMLILTKAIRKISEISKDELRNASGAIAGMMLVFGAVIALSNFAGSNALKAGGMILMMSGALLAISVVAAILSKLDPSGLARATASISILIGCFGLLVAASGLSKDCKSNLLVMTTAIGLMAVAIGTLSFIDPEKLKSTTSALAILMNTFSLMIASTNFSKNATKQLVVMVGVVGLLGTIISIMAILPMKNALSASASISLLLTSLSTSMLIISKTNGVSAKAIGSLYAISGTVAILATIIGVMSALNVGPTLEIASSLSMLLVTMTGVCGVLCLIGPASSQALQGALAFDGVVLAIGALMVGLGALVDKFPCMETFLDKGVDLLNGIANGIGEFIGNIIGGIGEGITDSLPKIGENLSKFADNISGVDSKVAKSAKALAETLLILGGAEIVDAIASWLTGDASIEDFAEQLEKFGQGIVDFSEAVNGKVDSEEVKNASEAGKKIIELAQMIPNSGGWLGNIVGNNDIEDFAPQMVKLGEGIVDFSTTITEGRVNSAAIENAAEAGKKIVELAQMIPNSGGWLGAIVGNNDIEDFAPQLEKFGQGIVDFSESVDNKVKIKGVTEAHAAGLKIIELAEMIPNSGGWLGAIAGNNDIEDFAPNLELFGKGIADFSSAVDGAIKVKPITSAREAGEKIIELSKVIYTSSKEISHVANAKYFGKLGSNLQKFGDSISLISKSSIATTSKESIDNAYANAKKLLDLVSLIGKMNGANIKSLPKMFSDLSKVSINSFVKNFNSSKSEIQKSVSTMIGYAKKAIQSEQSRFTKAGENCVDGFLTGISNKVKSGDVYGAGKEIGDAALKGARESLDIHSPSKKMREVAKNTVDGFINYISGDGTKKVKDSTGSMMDKSTDTSVKKTTTGIKKTGSTAIKTAKKVSKEFLTKMSKELAKVKKKYASLIDVDKNTEKTMAKFVKDGSKVTKVVKYAKDVITSFADTYGKTSKSTKANTEKASKAIASYIRRLYEQSDAYKEDQRNLKNLLKTQKKYYKEKVAITKKLSKVKTVDEKKQLEQELKNVKKNIKSVNKEIDKLNNTIAKNIKKTYTELKKSIKNMVDDYTDVFNAAKDTIDLFAEAGNSISDSLKSTVSIFDISLGSGTDIFSEFSTSDSAESIKQAEQDVADAKKDLAEAEEDLAKAREKSASVFGRSEKYLEDVREAEERVAEAQENVNTAIENLNNINGDNAVSDMLSNMESNVEGLEEYWDYIDKLSKRDIDDSLLKYLKELGVSGIEEVKTFVKMTDAELAKAGKYFNDFNKLSSKSIVDGFKEKKDAMLKWGDSISKFSELNLDDTVKEALLTEFQEQGVDSAEYIDAILNMTEEELKEFNTDYLEILKIPDKVADSVIEARNKIEGKSSGVDDYIENMKVNINDQKEYDANIEKLRKKAKEGLISEDFLEYLEGLGIESKDIIADFANASNEKLKEAADLYAESAKLSGDSFLDSFGDSISDVEKWNENIEKLSKLNIPAKIKDELINECIEQGIDSNELIETILGLTPEQLKEFVSLYKKKLTLGNDVAADVIADAAKVSNDKEKDKKSKDSKSKNSDNKSKDKKSTTKKPETEDKTSKSKSNKNSKDKKSKETEKRTGSTTGGSVELKSTEKSIKNGMVKISDDVTKQSIKIGDIVPTRIITGARDAINKKSSGINQISKNIMSTFANNLSEKNSSDIGENVSKGISSGISNTAKYANQAAYKLASMITNTMKNGLSELNNGSIMSGFLANMSNTNTQIKQESDSSISLMKDTIAKVVAVANSETVSTPTIRPVLDMSDVNTGLSNIHTILSSNAMGINASLAIEASNGMKTKGTSQNGSAVDYSYDYSQHTIENHFTINGDNPKLIANEVSRIIQQQINRRSTRWV